MNRSNTNWITQPEIQPNPKDDILTIEFPIPPEMKFRFLSVMTFGNEAVLEGKEAKDLEAFLNQLFKDFGETWSAHPKIKIQALIERPFVFKKKMRMKDRATAAEFYKKLSEKLNQLIPNGPTVVSARLASSAQSTDNLGEANTPFYKKRPSQPPLDGIIIIQEDGGNGT